MFQVSQEREREREGVSTRYDVGNTCEGLEKCGAGGVQVAGSETNCGERT